MGKKKNKGNKKLAWLFEYWLTVAVGGVINLIPYSLAYRMGGLLGSAVFRIDKRHQSVTLDNLRSSFKDKSEEEIYEIARSVFQNFGKSAIEFIRSERFFKDGIEKNFRIINIEAYDRALSKGKGLLLLTGHCGSWELLALAQSVRKPPFGVVARPMDNPYMEELVTKIRTRYGNFMIGKKWGMKEILKTVSDGGTVGILLDQNVARKEGVFVDFFGRPACTNKGMALIAARTKAPVIPAFIRRVDSGLHEIHIGDEIPLLDTGDKEADLTANTQAYTKAIENFIRQYPDQWFWVHRRWKTRPLEAPTEYPDNA